MPAPPTAPSGQRQVFGLVCQLGRVSHLNGKRALAPLFNSEFSTADPNYALQIQLKWTLIVFSSPTRTMTRTSATCSLWPSSLLARSRPNSKHKQVAAGILPGHSAHHWLGLVARLAVSLWGRLCEQYAKCAKVFSQAERREFKRGHKEAAAATVATRPIVRRGQLPWTRARTVQGGRIDEFVRPLAGKGGQMEIHNEEQARVRLWSSHDPDGRLSLRSAKWPRRDPLKRPLE